MAAKSRNTTSRNRTCIKDHPWQQAGRNVKMSPGGTVRPTVMSNDGMLPSPVMPVGAV